MTSQQDTELLEILENCHKTHCEVNARPPDCICGVKEAIQALTSWKDKEVIKSMLEGESNALSEAANYAWYCGRKTVDAEWLMKESNLKGEMLKSLQSQGGKNE